MSRVGSVAGLTLLLAFTFTAGEALAAERMVILEYFTSTT